MTPIPIPPRSPASAHLLPSQTLKISNPTGTQVIHLWAFTNTNTSSAFKVFNFKHLSMIHTRSTLRKLTLAAADHDALRDNEREAMLSVVEDTCGGVHCTLFAACDAHRYRQLAAEGHASCEGNLKAELASLVRGSGGEKGPLRKALASAARLTQEGWLPDPLNLFMNVPVTVLEEGEGGRLRLAPPTCPKGGYVVLRAEVECVVIMSACPMDLAAAGAYESPGAEFEIPAA